MLLEEKITIEDIIYAYQIGFFPMAEPDDGVIYWHCPDPRAIFEIHSLRIPRNVKQLINKKQLSFTVDREFDYVIRACADREETWISDEMIYLYNELHIHGIAHSIEVWENNKIIGGLYGLAIQGAFFGESMFNHISDASKAAFFYLVEHLKKRKYILLDSQYINDFTRSLGAIEIPKDEYLQLLQRAMKKQCFFSE